MSTTINIFVLYLFILLWFYRWVDNLHNTILINFNILMYNDNDDVACLHVHGHVLVSFIKDYSQLAGILYKALPSAV